MSDTAPKHDAPTRIDFLKALRPHGPWALTAIVPDGATTTISFDANEEAAMTSWIETANAIGKGIYHTGNLCGRPWKKPAKVDMTGAIFLHTDNDPRPGEAPADAKVRILATLEAHNPPPSIIIDSGNGLQAYWLLDQEYTFPPLTVAKTDENYGAEIEKRVAPIEDRNKALARATGAPDGTHNVDRLLRLPDTTNYPNAKKQREGRTICQSTIVKLTDVRHSLLSFPVVVGEAEEAKTSLHDEMSRPKGEELTDKLKAMLRLEMKPGEIGLYKTRNGALFAYLMGATQANIDRDVIVEACFDEAYAAGAIYQHVREQNNPRGYVKRQLSKARKKVGPPDGGRADLERLNHIYAVLPIGGKTRVVKFGEDDEFPGRETIVMTQTIDDFKSLNNKYRHAWQNTQLGNFWIAHKDRRQYDEGMAFMPNHDGDVGKRLNLWRGFGVKPIKGTCDKFLEFWRLIICNGDETHFDYHRKREALILQKRIRTEVALGLATQAEGCGKGFFERTLSRLLGSHAMQITKPTHIIGKHNPHLETLLRLTADEALFVHNPEHRNGLFELITESGLTIEPKFCGVYTARNYLNISVLSNAEHFLPVSDTARRFFIPTVSTARMRNITYFAGLQAELDNGGYEALLYHLLYEVDLEGFEVRNIPQTEALRQQRNLSLPPLEAWWCELLESGTLWGADPKEPNRAVSNEYQREIDVGEHVRMVKQPGLYDQARALVPQIRQRMFTDQRLGLFLASMDCNNNRKVLRRVGWTFPLLVECRDKWVAKYPGWVWRNPGLMEWQAEEGEDVEEADQGSFPEIRG